MGVCGGVYTREGNRPDPAIASALGVAMDVVASATARVTTSTVEMVYKVDPDLDTEPPLCQVHTTREGDALLWDGRLDYCDSVPDIGPLHKRPVTELPAAIISAYSRYGIETFRALIGDFAFALWDGRNARLVLGVDALGVRACYYHTSPHHVIWSSRADVVRRAGRIPTRISDDYVARYLMNEPSVHSPFEAIEQIQGGHVVIADKKSTTVQRYWSLDSHRSLKYSSDAEYEEHFRSLFTEAVRARLPGTGTAICELSGGLDSSTIASVAAEVCKEQPREREVFTLSYLFDRAPSSDERNHIDSAEQALGRGGTHIRDTSAPMLVSVPAHLQPDTPTNDLAFLARHDRLADEMVRRQARVVLNGMGGDQLFWSEPPFGLALSDLAAQLRLRQLFKEARTCAETERRSYVRTLWSGAVLPALWPAALLGGSPLQQPGDWYDRRFVRRTRLQERRLALKSEGFTVLPSVAIQRESLRRTMRPFALQRFVSKGYLDVRYPYLDRRLVEFALSLPLDQTIRGDETRSIVRRAFIGRIPESIRVRRSKAGPTEAFYRAVITQWPHLRELATSLRAAEYGFVDQKRFMDALHRAKHGLAMPTGQLVATLSLEWWLRTLERDGIRPDEGAMA